MCNQDNLRNRGAFGEALANSRRAPAEPVAPAPTSFAELFRPSPRGPAASAQPTGFASLFQPSARGPVEPTGLASVTPAARGPRNRRAGMER